jgi:hypothetical protein
MINGDWLFIFTIVTHSLSYPSFFCEVGIGIMLRALAC